MLWGFGHGAYGILWFLTSDWTCTPCIGRQILNHWATREVPEILSFESIPVLSPEMQTQRLELAQHNLRRLGQNFPLHVVIQELEHRPHLPDPGKDWRQEKGMTEDEVVGWHHWLNGHEFEQAPGDGDGQGGMACYSPWDHKELDTTEQLNNNSNICQAEMSLFPFCSLSFACFSPSNGTGNHELLWRTVRPGSQAEEDRACTEVVSHLPEWQLWPGPIQRAGNVPTLHFRWRDGEFQSSLWPVPAASINLGGLWLFTKPLMLFPWFPGPHPSLPHIPGCSPSSLSPFWAWTSCRCQRGHSPSLDICPHLTPVAEAHVWPGITGEPYAPRLCLLQSLPYLGL